MTPLEEYTGKRFSLLKKQLKKYSSEADIETLHEIRLEIKKIKAVLQLINARIKGFHAHRRFIPLRDIFRAAGKIRETDVLYELLLRYEIEIEKFHIPAEDNQELLAREFQHEVADYLNTIRIQERKLRKFLNKIHKSQIKKYLEKRKDVLRLQLVGRWTARSLHKARKVTKEILYVAPILGARKNSDTFFDKLQNLIGQWHDRQTLLPVLVKYKSPDLQRLKVENDNSVRRMRKFVSRYYGRKKQ